MNLASFVCSYSIANCLQRLSHLASYVSLLHERLYSISGHDSNMERYLSSLSLFNISQCYALFAPERTSVMRKVHALERQDLIEEMRIACMASDITRLPTLPRLMGPPSPHDCTVAYIELGSAPLCVLLGVSTDQKDRWLLQNGMSRVKCGKMPICLLASIRNIKPTCLYSSGSAQHRWQV